MDRPLTDAPGASAAGLPRYLWLAIAALVALTAAVQATGWLNQDVAFLTWAGTRVMDGAVFGRDVLEPNPPLSFIVYLPAALLGQLVGLDLAIRLWLAAVQFVSLALVAKAAPERARLPLVLALGLFVALLLPREYGQREQIALLLCAPWVTGHMAGRRLAVFSGVLAGIGFALKPYFLIALALVFLARRRVRVEEWAIAATGAAYALVLVLFFRPYIAEMTPRTVAVYWALGSGGNLWIQPVAYAVLLGLAGLVWRWSRDALALRLVLAALGFFVGAVLQYKYYVYHFIPTAGFVLMALAVQVGARDPQARRWALLGLGLGGVLLAAWSLPWYRDAEGRNRDLPRLLAEIDRSESFVLIGIHPYPAFPSAIRTRSRFVGQAGANWFLPAVAKVASGEADRPLQPAARMAIAYAVHDLAQRPELVIVDTDWRRHSGLRSASFDGLAWLRRDPAFAGLWAAYAPAGRVGSYALYRRRADGAAERKSH